MQGDVVTRCGDRAVADDEVFDDQGAWGSVGSPRGLSESEFVASGFWGHPLEGRLQEAKTFL